MEPVSVVGEGEGDAELKAVPLAFIVVAVEPHSALILYPLRVISCKVAENCSISLKKTHVSNMAVEDRYTATKNIFLLYSRLTVLNGKETKGEGGEQ